MNRPRASSAGPDNIPALLIKNLTPKAQGVVLKILNNIWQQQTFPDIWRKAIIIPVFNPGKQKTDANSYRPISLTCTLCKLLERMVNARIMWYIVTVRKFHSVRFSFFADLAGVEGPWVPLMLGDAPSLLEHLESNLKSNEFSKLSLAVRLRVIACYRDRFVCVFFVPDPSSSRSLVVVVNPFYLAFSFGFPCRLFFVFFSFGPS
jgi:hypothetical protein